MSSPLVVLDTTAAIAWLRREPGVPERFAAYSAVALPVIALGELLFGAEISAQPVRNRERVYDLAVLCVLLHVTEAVSARYAALRKALGLAGKMIPSNDLWIAATALEHAAPILSRDKHFTGVPGLACEDF